MSGTPSGRRWCRPASWSLRARLIALLVALLAGVCLIVGVLTQVALKGFLTDQLDGRLAAASARSTVAFGKPPEHPGRDHAYPPRPGPRFLLAPGQSAGTLGARVTGGTVDAAAVLDSSGSPRHVPVGQQRELARLSIGGKPTTRNLGTLGEYRLLTAPAPDGSVVVTGLPTDTVDDTLYRLALVEGVVAGVALLIAATAGTAVVRLNLRPLRRVAATATRVSRLRLDRGDVALAERVPEADTDPHTEVGRVGVALNRMLSHVADALHARQDSEMRVRRFVADASHELRTPLAAIRGYAEVTRRSREEAPPDLAHAMRRVESEATRMTSLVEDLLLLAKLDAGRPLAREPVDLSQLTVDAVSDAHVAGPDHRWHLDLPADPVIVPGDAERLHQVVANLLANARAHTPHGTTVTTGLAVAGDRAVLTVADDGPGIGADLLPEIFERFARGDGSRSRNAAGGTGLGLAIVSAVTESHHGTVHADSRPGRTTFTIRLPRENTG